METSSSSHFGGGGNFSSEDFKCLLWRDLVWLNDFSVSPRSQSHFRLRWVKKSNLHRHSFHIFYSFCECDLYTRLLWTTATSSSAFWHRFTLRPRSSHLGWSWSNSPVILRCPLAQSFCALSGSALTIKWVWPLSRKSFQYYYLWRAKHLIFASVSKALWRGSHLQVHVKEGVRYSTLNNTWTSENQTFIWSLTFLHLFYKKNVQIL